MGTFTREMPVLRRQLPLVDFLRRTFAAGSAALVLALGIFAASPQLHQWLHGDASLTHDDECAVMLFASGVSSPVAAIAVPVPPVEWQPCPYTVTTEVFLAAPRGQWRVLPSLPGMCLRLPVRLEDHASRKSGRPADGGYDHRPAPFR